MEIRYQPEIDGLRALAVLSVVAFHAVPRWCPGGFAGVDVFFVISGYLITAMIWKGLEGGTFTLAFFYERRIRRIVPALAVVLAAVMAAGWALMLPQDLAALGRSAAATALSVANVLFWRQTGYFGPEASTQPLLHAWSLAVEEQFYLAYPLLVMLLHRRFRARLRAILAVLLAASLVTALAWRESHPIAAFFLAPTRAWELLLGGLVALGAIPAVARRAARDVVGVAGLALVALAFALPERSAFPLPGIALACLGTAAILVACRGGASRTAAALSWRPLVFVGLVSYSLYLWHWPLLAFTRYASIPRASGAATLGCVAAAFALSVLTWRLVERPARSGMKDSRRLPFVAAAAALGALALAGGVASAAGGFPRRLPPRVAQLAAAAEDRDPRRDDYLSSERRLVDPESAPVFGAGPPDVAVWGDSHAAALMSAILGAARRHGASVVFFGYSGMPPLMDVRVVGTGAEIEGERYNERVAALLLSAERPSTVVLSARWALHVEGPSDDFGEEEPGRVSRGALAQRGQRRAADDQSALMARALETTVRRLRAAGKRVVIVLPTPELGTSVPRALALVAARGGAPESFALPARVFDARQRGVMAAIDAIREPGLVRVDPARLLRRGDGYPGMADGVVLYHDDDHLSLSGAAIVSPAFDAIFEGLPR